MYFWAEGTIAYKSCFVSSLGLSTNSDIWVGLLMTVKFYIIGSLGWIGGGLCLVHLQSIISSKLSKKWSNWENFGLKRLFKHFMLYIADNIWVKRNSTTMQMFMLPVIIPKMGDLEFLKIEMAMIRTSEVRFSSLNTKI